MSVPGPQLWQQARDLVETYGPWALTELHLIASALLPIYAGAHASLSRPLSAAKAGKKRRRRRDPDDDQERRMEGLTPADAIVYPLLTGLMLTGLYYLIKWLQDPEVLNKIINGYLSIFGVFAISRFLTDMMTTTLSFLTPLRYRHGGQTWYASLKNQQYRTRGSRRSVRRSPWPGVFSRVPSPKFVQDIIWKFRDFVARPLYVFEGYIHGVFEASIAVGPLGQLNSLIALAVVLYYNFVAKPWWLTNLMGFSFAYGALQLMSPTTFWTGTLVLTALFFYDIYFVFFTPMMITVATKLDAPIKLLIPRPADEQDDPSKKPLSMIGLGDVVLPGIMIGLALRFDLYLFYLKKQRHADASTAASNGRARSPRSRHRSSSLTSASEALVYDRHGVGRAVYRRATGGWGERFWLGSATAAAAGEGGAFPKPYFRASLIGYVAGLLLTLAVMYIYQHGQPALLYLVPSVLLSLWGTALVRGERALMWAYSELEPAALASDAKPSTTVPIRDSPTVKNEASPRTAHEKLAQAQQALKRRSMHETDDEAGDYYLMTENSQVIYDAAAPTARRTSAEEVLPTDSDSEPPPLAEYESSHAPRPPRALFAFSCRLPSLPGRDERDGDGKVDGDAAAAEPRRSGRHAAREGGRSGAEAAEAPDEPDTMPPSRNIRTQHSLRRRV